MAELKLSKRNGVNLQKDFKRLFLRGPAPCSINKGKVGYGGMGGGDLNFLDLDTLEDSVLSSIFGKDASKAKEILKAAKAAKDAVSNEYNVSHSFSFNPLFEDVNEVRRRGGRRRGNKKNNRRGGAVGGRIEVSGDDGGSGGSPSRSTDSGRDNKEEPDVTPPDVGSIIEGGAVDIDIVSIFSKEYYTHYIFRIVDKRKRNKEKPFNSFVSDCLNKYAKGSSVNFAALWDLFNMNESIIPGSQDIITTIKDPDEFNKHPVWMGHSAWSFVINDKDLEERNFLYVFMSNGLSNEEGKYMIWKYTLSNYTRGIVPSIGAEQREGFTQDNLEKFVGAEAGDATMTSFRQFCRLAAFLGIKIPYGVSQGVAASFFKSFDPDESNMISTENTEQVKNGSVYFFPQY